MDAVIVQLVWQVLMVYVKITKIILALVSNLNIFALHMLNGL